MRPVSPTQIPRIRASMGLRGGTERPAKKNKACSHSQPKQGKKKEAKFGINILLLPFDVKKADRSPPLLGQSQLVVYPD